MKSLSILILAAGKGTRMKSQLPKVLHPIGGVPMIDRVLYSVSTLKPKSICVIVGFGGEEVKKHILNRFPRTEFATQKSLDGSGGAVCQALAWLKKQQGDVIVTCGDAPLISRASFEELLDSHRRENNTATVLTTKMPNPFGYGRIVRSRDGSVDRIVEHLDATPKELDINEINTGTYCFNASALAMSVPKLKNNNAKKEFYLTDTLAMMKHEGGRIGGVICIDPEETMGINSRQELSRAESALYRRKLETLMANGVTILDPRSTYINDAVKIGPDTVIWPQTYILGNTRIGSGCRIGPWAHITDSKIENGVIFQASFAEQCVIRRGARVGPYSRVRPKSDIGPNVHLGNFSEVKNTKMAAGSKCNHLSYLGDAKIGKNVNIGAGSITCNYDGIQKFPTQIQDNAFIGSNVNLIAPLKVGKSAVIGAGSSINEDVPAWSLVVSRAPRVVKKDWAKNHFKKGKK